MSHIQDKLSSLSSAQRAVLKYIDDRAASLQPDAVNQLTHILQRAHCTQEMLHDALECIRHHARIVLHFHPDRYGKKQITVAEALLKEGQYRSQFETGLSSGGRSAFPGGDRDNWERTLFGGVYHHSESTEKERPKYGALELIRYPDGPWPRFGSSYLVLRVSVSSRSTFTFSGSEQSSAPERVGTIDRMDVVMAALLAEIEKGEGARVPWPPFVADTLGVKGLTVSRLLKRLSRDLPSPRPNPSIPPAGRVLDTGIEAQVHGPVDLRRDVERIVVDPSFQGTTTGEFLIKLSRKYSIPLDWHCGFRLAVREILSEFRGPAIPRIALRIAGDGVIDTAVIGAAEASLHLESEKWRDWGTHDETLQHLKQLWHVLFIMEHQYVKGSIPPLSVESMKLLKVDAVSYLS